jgi:hypothetical protein
MRRRERLAALVLLLSCTVAAMALPDALQQRIERMPAPMRAQLREREARLATMDAASRQALQARRAHWDALPEDQRAALRERWQAWQSLPAAQRQQVRDAAAAFAALPLDRQHALQLQFAQLSEDARRGWLLGPQVGAEWTSLQPLLMQVQASERQPLLAQLLSMPAAELHDLAVLAQRTPPQEREALRRGLLSTDAGNRAAWLRLRLER